MSKKIALCRVSDTEPLLSLVTMLEYAGYECMLPSWELRNFFRGLGCRNVDEFEDMRDRWGAEMPPKRLKELTYQDWIAGVDLYVDVNAFHNGPLVWKSVNGRNTYLEKKTLCYFINGGPPRNTADKGDGITPACPVMTTNQWYATNTFQHQHHSKWYYVESERPTWLDKSYIFYPSFERSLGVLPRTPDLGGSPVCFCHNVMGWGYGEYIEEARKLGCKFYGGGSSPDGLVRHEDVFSKLSKAPCVVYLKGGGAVDYAVLESMAMGVPVIVPNQYIEDTRLQELLGGCVGLPKDGLVVTLDNLLHKIRDPVRNFRIGELGKQKVKELCWQPERDGPGFVTWLERMFGE